ncbi:MAG: murein biosynthesis integral membrane protein MurJ [bacterium]|nr:murein biosynthesis integral membrane protein MurJ [bacterium]
MAVLLSRVVGLIRDIMVARFVGGGASMSAWVLAFRIPNTFRRFLGEGAATQALIPLLGDIIKNKGLEEARRNFGTILATITLVLGVITIVIAVVSIFLQPYFQVYRVNAALGLMPILMPYTLFICLTGICAGILNLFEHYFWPAMTSVVMNIAIIIALALYYNSSTEILINRMSWAVLISGIFQLGLLMYLLYKINALPHNFVPGLWNSPIIKQFIVLAIPGFIGAAAMQINTLVDSFIAVYLGDYAAPALYFSERLIYLPIGIFAVSLGNACLVAMSKNAAENKILELIGNLVYGLKQMIFISIPIAVFLLFFRFPILSLIYRGDRFGTKSLDEAAWAMLFYCLGIPAFCMLKIIVSAYYSRKEMKTPVKVALFCVLLNFVLNLILMYPLRQGGIALATVISSFVNCFILLFLLRKLGRKPNAKTDVLLSLTKTLISAFIAIAVSFYLYRLYHKLTILNSIDWRGLISLSMAALIFCIGFFIINLILKSSDQKEWLNLIAEKLK